jgi:hypothetical protein
MKNFITGRQTSVIDNNITSCYNSITAPRLAFGLARFFNFARLIK